MGSIFSPDLRGPVDRLCGTGGRGAGGVSAPPPFTVIEVRTHPVRYAGQLSRDSQSLVPEELSKPSSATAHRGDEAPPSATPSRRRRLV
ncbi:hypothetical protein AAFF_G00053650 [Aldrovandia affinis]|uniref:Uncharacterized protein n=1 Tax=Aldrovandia affinis TaxID=143900 RepID=A0AAD7S101_9TELE|nr:hypothetical protein AAFF_G00053650 [Aldrovandia affinis]